MERNFDICWVCFPLREGLDGLRGELALARREFLTNGRKTVRAGKDQTVKGFSGKLKGKLSRRSMFWEKKVAGASGGSVTLEESFRVDEGWLVVMRDLHGAIVSRVYFDLDQRWIRSEYYEPWNASIPRVAFAKGEGPGQVERLDWDNEQKDFHQSRLYPAPYRSGTAEQSVADAQFGQPLLVLLTTDGELCCCTQSQAKAREEAAASGAGGTMVLMPAWEVKEGELVSDGEENISFTSLEEYAKIEPKEEDAELTAASDEPGEPVLPPDEITVQATEDGGADSEEAPEAQESHTEDAGEEDEISSLAETEEASPADNGETIVDQLLAEDEAITASELEETDEAAEPAPQLPEGEPNAAFDSGSDTGLDASGGHLETILVEAQVAESSLQAEPGQSAPAGYQMELTGGKITGRGRTQQPNGLTSYEGEYQDGKRHGFGSHYYKDGALCYAGFWKDDRRDGLGVSFRDSDHAIHVAHWSDGKPDGLVALFDADGGLRYSGRVENGKKEGAGVVINSQDGAVFVGQWSGGEATGLGSAFDKDGRLLYYGNWQNGKRHGHGTQFDENGGVVFDGEWREDKYYNGVLYQKLSQPEWES